MKQILALLLVSFAVMPAAVADVTADVTLPIRQFIDGFNNGDTKAAFGTYAKGSISLVDEFAPHQWTGPVTDGKVTYSPPTRTEIEGNVAYVIMQ
jgi:hypothetical protein